ncbi:MAG TPA: DNA recombination protein RmuC [Verrucomicrobiae bacterium]
MPLAGDIAIAFAVGILVGWVLCLLRRRPPDGRLEEELRQQVQSRERELAAAREQHTKAAAALAGAEANQSASQLLLTDSRQNFADSLRAAREAQDRALADLRETFKALSADALKESAPQFLQLARETLAGFQESAKGDLATRHQAIATLVEPLKEQLEAYQRRLQQSESSQAQVLGEVKAQLEGLAQNSQALSTETLQLRKVLSSNQARGRWGEETLRRVVEAAGMSPHCDFSEQAQSDDKKPDLLVHLPGERVIIIDAKVPDLDFLTGLDSAAEAARAQALTLHAAKLKETIKDLARKDYPAQFPGSLDYVVLFMPAEALFSAALEADRDLILWAAQRKIMLATPASLIALLRAVSVSWQHHAQTENAREISAAAQELFNRVATFTEHLEKIRAGLKNANAAMDSAVSSYQRMVRPSGERLARLSGGIAGKELANIEPLEAAPRLPTI